MVTACAKEKKMHFRATPKSVQTEVTYGGSGLYQDSDPHMVGGINRKSKYQIPWVFTLFTN